MYIYIYININGNMPIFKILHPFLSKFISTFLLFTFSFLYYYIDISIWDSLT